MFHHQQQCVQAPSWGKTHCGGCRMLANETSAQCKHPQQRAVPDRLRRFTSWKPVFWGKQRACGVLNQVHLHCSHWSKAGSCSVQPPGISYGLTHDKKSVGFNEDTLKQSCFLPPEREVSLCLSPLLSHQHHFSFWNGLESS